MIKNDNKNFDSEDENEYVLVGLVEGQNSYLNRNWNQNENQQQWEEPFAENHDEENTVYRSVAISYSMPSSLFLEHDRGATDKIQIEHKSTTQGSMWQPRTLLVPFDSYCPSSIYMFSNSKSPSMLLKHIEERLNDLRVDFVFAVPMHSVYQCFAKLQSGKCLFNIDISKLQYNCQMLHNASYLVEIQNIKRDHFVCPLEWRMFVDKLVRDMDSSCFGGYLDNQSYNSKSKMCLDSRNQLGTSVFCTEVEDSCGESQIEECKFIMNVLKSQYCMYETKKEMYDLLAVKSSTPEEALLLAKLNVHGTLKQVLTASLAESKRDVLLMSVICSIIANISNNHFHSASMGTEIANVMIDILLTTESDSRDLEERELRREAARCLVNVSKLVTGDPQSALFNLSHSCSRSLDPILKEYSNIILQNLLAR